MKIQIVQLGRIGDMILATPLFYAIKNKYPQAKIDIITGTKNYKVISDNPRINKIKILDKRPPELFQFIKNNLKEKYDFHIDPKDHYSTESKWLALMTKADTKIGYNKPNSKVFHISLPSDADNQGLHYTQRCFNSLVPLGIDIPQIIPKPELFPNKTSETKAEDFIKKIVMKDKLAVINISASKQSKMLQPEKWISLINDSKLLNYTFVINSAPQERTIAEHIANETNCLVFKPESILDVISLIKRSDLLISPDTSLIHIASAFNVPIIGIYSGLEEFYNKFHPLSDKYIAIRAEKDVDTIQTVEYQKILDALKHFEF